MAQRRIVVGTSGANVDRASEAPLVGVFAWSKVDAEVDDQPLLQEWLTILIKTRIDARTPQVLRRPEVLFARPAQAEPFQRPVDFVPLKDCVDVAVVGHVTLREEPSAPARRPLHVSGTLSIGGETTQLELMADEPGRVPLTVAHARVRGVADTDGALGPVNLYDGAEDHFQHRLGFPMEVYQCASRPHLLRERVEEGSAIVMSMIVEGRSEPIFEATLPAVSPRLVVDFASPDLDKRSLDAALDTVLIDLDKQQIELTYRAFLMTPSVKDLDRLLLGWCSKADLDSGAGGRAIARNLPRGQFHYAWFFEDADKGVPPPNLTPEEEKVARYQSWIYPIAPEPALSLEAYAEISVELAERMEPRASILSRHGLDEHAFALEERAWLERVTAETRSHKGQAPTATQLTAAREQAAEALRRRRLQLAKDEP